MLNPSTADADADDPTIRRCINFARRDGFGALTVVNLFALRATNPKEIETAAAPTGGTKNDEILKEVISKSERTVCAWGGNVLARERAAWFFKRFSQYDLYCLGLTIYGAPRHPLYVKSDTPLRKFEGMI